VVVVFNAFCNIKKGAEVILKSLDRRPLSTFDHEFWFMITDCEKYEQAISTRIEIKAASEC
jgi:hypothetical protein